MAGTKKLCQRGWCVVSRIGEELLGSVRSRKGEERRTFPDRNVAGDDDVVDTLEEETTER